MILIWHIHCQNGFWLGYIYKRYIIFYLHYIYYPYSGRSPSGDGNGLFTLGVSVVVKFKWWYIFTFLSETLTSFPEARDFNRAVLPSMFCILYGPLYLYLSLYPLSETNWFLTNTRLPTWKVGMCLARFNWSLLFWAAIMCFAASFLQYSIYKNKSLLSIASGSFFTPPSCTRGSVPVWMK